MIGHLVKVHWRTVRLTSTILDVYYCSRPLKGGYGVVNILQLLQGVTQAILQLYLPGSFFLQNFSFFSAAAVLVPA